jgi:hypothetical protein
MNDRTISSDYYFLEDVLKCRERAKRTNVDLGGIVGGRQNGNNNQYKRQRRDTPDDSKMETEQEQVDDSGPVQPLLELSLREKNAPSAAGSAPLMTIAQPSFMSESCKGRDNASKRRQLLVQQAAIRGCTLVLMAPGLERAKGNSSYYHSKQDTLMWKVEWRFHFTKDEPGAKDNQHDPFGKKVEQLTVMQHKVSEKEPLLTALRKQVDAFIATTAKGGQSQEEPNRMWRRLSSALHDLTSRADSDNADTGSTPNINDKNAMVANSFKQAANDGGSFTAANVSLFVKKVPCSANKPLYHPILSSHHLTSNNNVATLSLGDALKEKTIIEHPTIEVTWQESVIQDHFPTPVSEAKE